MTRTAPRDALSALKAVGAVERDLEGHRRTGVRAAAGEHTWAEIGEALGVSRQAAHRKFAKEWASTVKSQVKAEARTYKAARRSGDRAAAETGKRSLDELVAEVKRSARAQRGRG